MASARVDGGVLVGADVKHVSRMISRAYRRVRQTGPEAAWKCTTGEGSHLAPDCRRGLDELRRVETLSSCCPRSALKHY